MRRIQIHATITGDLGATSFRSMIRRQAEKLQIVGWVLQHGDGTIEAVVNGSERNVRVFLSWCERGPLAEVVTGVETINQPREAFFGFSVRQPPKSTAAREEDDTEEEDA